jgi:hypothetical protein
MTLTLGILCPGIFRVNKSLKNVAFKGKFLIHCSTVAAEYLCSVVLGR